MKILQVINDLRGGGAEKLIADFAPLMRNKGHEVEVLLLRSKGSLYIEDLERNNIKVTHLSSNNLYSFSHIFRIRNFIKKGKFDIVNVHVFPVLYFVSLASLLGLGKAKLCYTEHSTFNRRRTNEIYRTFDKFIYDKYKRVIAISFDVKKALMGHLNCESEFISVINNGVDIKKFKDSPAINLSNLIKGYHSEDKIICMVSRFSKAKDQLTLIRAISLLPKNIKLLLIGEGPLVSNCITLSEDLNIKDRVYFLGFRRDVQLILKSCDIGVLSSNWEGMPIFALEVFATGIPFIGSKVPGIKDLFVDENESELMLFKNKDSEGLSMLLKRILEEEDVKVKNIEICQKIVNKFSLEKMTNTYLKFYKELL